MSKYSTLKAEVESLSRRLYKALNAGNIGEYEETKEVLQSKKKEIANIIKNRIK